MVRSPPCTPTAPPPRPEVAVIRLFEKMQSEKKVSFRYPPPTYPAPPTGVVSRPPVICPPDMWNTKLSTTLGFVQITRSDVDWRMAVVAEPAPTIRVLLPATSRSPTLG